MDIAVTGASGLIGSRLVADLRADGHRVRPVVRRDPASPDDIRWDPAAGTIDAAALAGVDAVVNLAGEGIGEKRWSPEQKARIERSRIDGTSLMARTVAALDPLPRAMVSGSATGYYGDGGDAVLTESSPAGDDFLAKVCIGWEAATAPAEAAGIRVARIRTSLVLAPGGGALGKMLPLFKLGLGGRLGSGRQWWPWIALDDEVGAIRWLLDHDVSGPVNLASPNPATNAQVTRALGRVLHRPTVLPVPTFGPGLVLGRELADALLFTSTRAVPAVLTGAGYRFRHPDLDSALEAAVGG